MKIIDASGAILGRLASYVAKEALKGEEFAILNCEEIIISGNKKMIGDKFAKKRRMVGTGQTGPKHPKPAHMIVKRAIRGMLPEYKFGRGRPAFKRIKCYKGIPQEFADAKKITAGKEKPIKFSKVGEFTK